ncbi:MAG TPA: CAP domain-containing protein [Candidatus Dormibacteraeota bacterium]|jgi:uncharacterized protein YkwD
MHSQFATRFGSLVVALVITAGLALSTAPVEAAAAGSRTHLVWRCAVRHHVRHCIRIRVAWHPVTRHHVVRHAVVRPVAARPQPAAPAPRPTGVVSGGYVGQEIALVNQERGAAGLPALAESAALDRIATARGQDMATNGYFAHYRPGDSTLAVVELLRANGVGYSWAGENIIWESGQPAGSLATYFNTWWMNSPEHRANILNAHYGHIGVGMVTTGSRVYMVEDFTN